MENSVTFLFFSNLILGAMSAPEGKDLPCSLHRCPPPWRFFGVRCYKYVSSPKSWIDAEEHCQTEGGNLVSIHFPAEESFVKNLIRNFDAGEGPTWIGLTDVQSEGTWQWSDGSNADFTLWNPGEPNNSGGNEECVQTNWGDTKNWNDKDCSESYPFVCSAYTHCWDK